MSTPLPAHRSYTGSIDHHARWLRSAADGLLQESTGLERRLWTEDQAAALVTSWLPHIRESLDRAKRALAEMEATLTTVAEEQAAAMDVTNRDAA
jgi:hypothetical protein